MLSPLYARPPADRSEERVVRRLAAARHAPASWLHRARIITASWDGAQVGQIAEALGCHPKTVYRWLHRFNTGGVDALGDQPRSGRPRRLSERERGRIVVLARSRHWTLAALAAAAQAEGIQAGRSQIRRIILVEGERWRPESL